MACIREAAANGRLGIVSCDEEGCLFRCYATERGTWTTDETPETDCVLQLRLRAGDSEDIGASGELREAETGPGGRPVRVLESGIYDFGIVAHDNGKTEHNRIREEGERFLLGGKSLAEERTGSMGLPAESGGTEGEPQLDRKGNRTMSGEDEYGREPRTVYKNAKIERSDILDERDYSVRDRFGRLLYKSDDRGDVSGQGGAVDWDRVDYFRVWIDGEIRKFSKQDVQVLVDGDRIERYIETTRDSMSANFRFIGDAPDDTPRDDKGRIDYIRFLTERVPGLVTDEIERREAERIKRSLEEALERFKQPSLFITPPEARARLTEGTASANDITKSLGIPNNGGGYEAQSNATITYRDAPRRSGWFKRLFGRRK